MDRMSRARARHRQWRESMTYSQRQEYLARRREQAPGKRPVVEIDHDYQSQFDQVLEGENVHQCEELGPSGTSQPAPYHSENLHFSRSLHVDNDGPQYSRRRLTHVRQLARMDRSHISEDVQNFLLHGECIRGVRDLLMLNHAQTDNSNMSLNIGNDMTINDVRMNVNEEDHDMENVFTPIAPVHSVQQQRRIRRPRIIHNSARDFDEYMGIPYCELPAVRRCPYCQAMLFHQETFSLCCCKGNIVLPLIQSLPEMVRLFSDQTNEGRKFR